MNKPTQTGMTLIELIVTVSIVAILAAFASPALSEMMENNRLTALNNQLVSNLNYVRGEAVKRAYDVTMCVRNSTGSDCAGSGGYHNGWIVFVDCNSDNAVTTTNVCDYLNAANQPVPDGIPDSPEEILLDTTPDFQGVAVTGTSAVNPRVRYKPSGSIAGVNGTLTLVTDPEDTLTLSVDSVARYRIRILAATGRISSCKVGTTGC